MSTVVRPVGPQPPRVYWVRRVVVLLLVVGVVVGLVAGVSALLGGAGADAAADPGAEPTEAVEGDVAADGETVTGPGPCAAADLTVALTADARTYPAGSNPLLSLAVTNNGTLSCTLEAGEASREVVITSGTDRIWSSLDCLADPPGDLQLLASGARYDATLTWSRVRSDAACTADLPAPRPGTYTAVATIAGASSAAVVFELG